MSAKAAIEQCRRIARGVVSPSTVTVPWVGLNRPASVSSSVVCPGPPGIWMAWKPGAEREIDIGEERSVLAVDPESGGGDDRLHVVAHFDVSGSLWAATDPRSAVISCASRSGSMVPGRRTSSMATPKLTVTTS